jgi:hypothetical protein
MQPQHLLNPNQTYHYGANDECRGYGFSVSNGRLIEKTKRKMIFFKKHNIVKH